jgi:hypothetical protein
MRKDEEGRLLSELVDIADRLGQWEQEFVESISDQLDRTGRLTDRQREKLIEVHERRVLGY